MSRYTPGPWAVNPLAAQVDALPSCLPVCQLLWPTDERSEAETESNARLIAAAPELLAALEEMVRWYAKRETASMCVSGGEGLLPIEAQDDEVQQAMRAIAKATGESA